MNKATGTGKADEQGLLNLLEYSEISVGVHTKMVSHEATLFVFHLLQNMVALTMLGSMKIWLISCNVGSNSLWHQIHRDKGIGSRLYSHIIEYSNKQIAAEVSLNPPNLASMRFHGRFDFGEIGELHHETYSVNLMLRKAE